MAAAAVAREARPAAARTRACGRCPGGGSQPWSAVRTSRSRSGPARASQRADRGVDLPQRAVEALDVLAVPVDLVGLDEVREHEARVELVEQRGRRRRSPRRWSRPRAPRRRRRRRTPGRPCRRRAPARRRPAAPAGRCAPGGVEREVAAARRCARTRPAPRANGRAITRPTACSPRMISRAGRAGRVQLGRRDDVLVRGDLQHRVRPTCRRSGHRCARCSLAEVVDHRGAGVGPVAEHPRPVRRASARSPRAGSRPGRSQRRRA